MPVKFSIGSWAYTFGPYAKDPIDLPTVCAKLGELGFDGIELGGFRPHAHPDDYATPAKQAQLKKLLADNGLGVSAIAADFWSDKLAPWETRDAYIATFRKNLDFCKAIGIPCIRVDTVAPPPGPAGAEREDALLRCADVWHMCADIAAPAKVKVTWEFEPGFAFNKPSDIVRMAEEVDHPNFGILYDACHAHMVSVVGARQPEPVETLAGGEVELAGLLKGKINHIHLIDSDNTLHGDETSTHRPVGEGVIDFDAVIPAIIAAGYTSDWWVIDLCFWPGAWEVTEAARNFLKPYAAKYAK
ncbi:MAG: sugar phosphate isomerase/epimerase [Planctomycetes bacterium]|nr:sugar phosphate isomerase/epimerase [Planctomycetota bacterium]